VTQHTSETTENNTITVNGSTLSNSPMTSGSHSHVTVSPAAGPEDQQVASAISELQQGLQQAQAAVDGRDDETREALQLAASRLTALEAELHTDKPKRDWSRVKKLMTGIRDALTGLTSLTVSVNALWDAVEKVTR
jgi:hypothetical protein